MPSGPSFHNNVNQFQLRGQNVPAAVAAGTRNGTGIDRLARGSPQSCLLWAYTGAATGAPDSYTVDAKVQDSADNITFADYVPPRSPANVQPGVAADGAITQITADSSLATKAIDLSSAKRYVRVSEVTTLTGGTTPKALVASGLILAGADTNPIP